MRPTSPYIPDEEDYAILSDLYEDGSEEVQDAGE
jgi:hypothetical protein